MREPFTINGMTGRASDDANRYDPQQVIKEKHFAAMLTSKSDDEIADAVGEACVWRMAEHEAVQWHRTLEPLMDAADELASRIEMAIRNADSTYGLLERANTSDWAATHHRWVLDVDATWTLIRQYEQAHAAAAAVEAPNNRAIKVYRECGWGVAAEGRTSDRDLVRRLPNWGNEVDARIKEFEFETLRKTALAAKTLQHLTTASG